MDKQANEKDKLLHRHTGRQETESRSQDAITDALTANLALKFLQTKKSSKASLHHVPSTESDGNYNSIHLPSGKSHKLWAKQWTSTPPHTHNLGCPERKGKAFQRSKGVYLI